MIYTLSLNPAIDMNIRSDKIAPKKVNRTTDAFYTPNGKGLNVTFTLEHFQVDTTTLGFYGGFSGRYIVEETKARNTGIIPVWIEGTTRINIFLNDGEDEYKFVNEGAEVPPEAEAEFLSLLETLEDFEMLVISGSMPKGMKEEYYDQILKVCQKRNAKVVLDISSQKLVDLLAYQPFLIKPNDEEIEKILGITIKNEEDVVMVTQKLHTMGAQNILLTLGDKGSYFYNGKTLYYANAKKITLLSSACAGDVALGAFLSIFAKDTTNIEAAMIRSAAAGAQAAESEATGDFTRVEEYQKDIHVRVVR